MTKNILILTNYFPFHKGEEYLEAELPYLCRLFDEVTVVPVMTTSDMRLTRQVPEGVRVVNSLAGRSTTGRFTDMAAHAVRISRRDAEGLRAPVRPWRHPVHVAFDAYFESRARAALGEILSHEDELLPGNDGPVVIYSYWFYLTARIGASLKHRWSAGRPVTLVSRGHGYDVNVHASAVRYLPQRTFLLDHVDRLHPVSDAATSYFHATYPQFAEKVSTRRLGSPRRHAGHDAKQAALRVVSVSTIRPLKRLEIIADALEVLRKTYPAVTWTHIGAGAGTYADGFLADVAQRFPPGTVELTGHMTNDEVHGWYRQNPSTVFVNVSSSEGVPVSVMEAMSHGLPVIATDVGGTRELFTPAMREGLLDAEVDGTGLATTVAAVFSRRPHDYAVLSDASFDAWQAAWDADHNFEEFARELAQSVE